MPLLGSLIISLFGGIASFLVRFLAVRAAAVTAAVATFTALTVALYAVVAGLAAGIAATFPGLVLTGVWLFVPDNAVACFAACIACDTACALYRWNTGTLKLAASVA
jgi:mannitol-specific phosphotransferase system IIBC component